MITLHYDHQGRTTNLKTFPGLGLPNDLKKELLGARGC